MGSYIYSTKVTKSKFYIAISIRLITGCLFCTMPKSGEESKKAHRSVELLRSLSTLQNTVQRSEILTGLWIEF